MLQDLRQELLRALRAGLAEEIVLGGVLDDLAAVHEDHAVGDLARESHLVGHAHHGHAFLGEFDHHVEHLVDHLRVERGGRFVEEHRDRVHRERARDRHPLLLPAGELAGKFRRLRREAHAVEELSSTVVCLVRAATEHLHLRERQVLDDREMREQLEVLEHHAHAGAKLGQVGAGITH